MPTHFEDGMDIITLKDLGPPNLETTLEYLQIAQLESQQKFSPLDTLFCAMQPQVADVLKA
jgi:hypothetical protein